MKFNDFKKEIKQSKQVHIENRMSTIDVSSYLEVREDKTSWFNIRRIAYIAASFLIVFVLAFSINSFYTPVSTLTIDLNPSLKVDVNVFNRVLNVEGLNDDGTSFVSVLDYKNMKLDNFLLEVKDEAYELGYIDETDAFLIVGIYSETYEEEIEINDLLQSVEGFNILSITKHHTDDTINLYDSYISSYTESMLTGAIADQESNVIDQAPTYDSSNSEFRDSNEYEGTEAQLAIINIISLTRPGDLDYYNYLLGLTVEELIVEYNNLN